MTPMRRPLIVLIALLPLAAARPALSQPATTQATTQPTGRATPGEVLITQYRALLRGDADTLRHCFRVTTADDEQLLTAYVAMADALKAARLACENKFGKGSFVNLGVHASFEREIQRLATAKIVQRGQATLIYAQGEQRRPTVLVRGLDRQWQIDLAQSIKNPARQAEVVRQQARLYDELALEILEGRHKTVQDAAAARESRLLALRKAASRPATSPDED